FASASCLVRGGLLTFGDAHISNLHSTISSHSFFQYGSGSIVWKLMEMATTQTLFCRMDYQNGSVWKKEQDEAGRSCGNEQKRSIWKTVVSHTQQERVPSSLQMEVKAAL